MRRLIKIVLVLTLLACAAAGVRHALAQRGNDSDMQRSAFASAVSRPHAEIRVDVGEGSFVLKNLTLARVNGSTVLKGSVVNKTKHTREQVSFEVRAYDRDGRVLKGLESKTVFAAHKLKANSSAPINHGYGVWLQGVSLEDVARIEVSETGERADVPIMARLIPLAGHALDVKRYAEIDE
jgi:pSer/pThr/pTyr-binding forkhead associated (FHA) protein